MKRKGFTLIEILTSLAVFGIIFVAVGSVFYSVYLSWKKQRDFNRHFQAGRWALEFMSNEIRHTNGLNLTAGTTFLYMTTPPPGNSLNWGGCAYDFNATEHILYRCFKNKAASRDAACGSGGQKKILATSVADANFTVSDGDLAGISLTIRPIPNQAEGLGNRNITFETKVRGRN